MILKPATVACFLTLITQIAAQTHSSCNPLTQSCPADPALSSHYSWDFTHGPSDRFKQTSSTGLISFSQDGVDLTINQAGQYPTIASDFYIMFGHVDIVAKAAPGVGIVSAAVLISDNLDEIDWEWLGGDGNRVQTNYFSKGDISTYDRSGFSNAPNSHDDYHTYGIDWTASRVVWTIDGQTVRVLNNPGTGYYPQTPMQIRLGSWAGGDPSNAPGTIEWAGGKTDYSQGPFTFSVKSISVQDYSTGKEYAYGDHSGSWTSIQAIDGSVGSEGDHTVDEGTHDSNPNKDPSPNKDNTPTTLSISIAPETSTPVSTESVAPAPPVTTETPAPPAPTTTTTEAPAPTTAEEQKPEPAPSQDSSPGNDNHPQYDDGMYHPDPKFDDGMYHPDSKFHNGMYSPELYGRSVNGNNNDLYARSNGGAVAKANLFVTVGVAASCIFVYSIAF